MATYVTETMQAISAATNSLQQQQPTPQQQNQTSNNSGHATPVVTVSANQSNKTVGQNATQATIIHPAQGGQQFIVTIAEPAGDHTVTELQPGTGQVVYPAHAQYVDGSETPIYAASNGQMQTYTDYGQPTMYTPVSGTYYQATSGTQMSGLGSIQGQILTHQGGTYLVHGGTMDGEGHPLTHSTRASPATVVSTNNNVPRTSNFDAKCWQRENSGSISTPVLNVQNYQGFLQDEKLPTWTKPGQVAPQMNEHLETFHVQWLIDNYETAEGVSLPRSTLYNHYLRHCSEQKMDPMNPASFGKLIRSVFLGLRTRRLGTRGNSKYHYYGIRIKATSPLNQFSDDQTMALRQQPINQGKRFKSSLSGREGGMESSHISAHAPEPGSQQHQHQQFLGDASGAIPNLGTIEINGEPLPENVLIDQIRLFEQFYKEHCESILDVVVNLQFSLIEAIWQSFWRSASPETHHSGDIKLEQRLPKETLYAMCTYEPVLRFVRRSDYAFYQALVEVLIPDVLRPIPSSLTQAIRNFAKSLEGWLKTAMEGVPEQMTRTKIGAVSAFAQTLRRYTSLNHLAQAARAVLQNTSQINQMLTDLNRVDFANVQEQASWVCQCDDTVVHQLEQDFKKTLQQHNPLEQWAIWLEGVVNQVLKPHEGSPNFPKAARQFLLKWSFYSSMVIRDLTLRSAASFGSFHLIRLLYDEYMFYLVEHKVAAATDETPIAVMGEVRQIIDMSNMMNLGSMNENSNEPLSPVSLGQPMTPHTGSAAITPPSASLHNHEGGIPSLMTTSNGPMPATGSMASSAPIIAANSATSLMATNPHNSNAATVTLLASGSTPTKTIVVVPVSAGSGDPGTPNKKLKTL